MNIASLNTKAKSARDEAVEAANSAIQAGERMIDNAKDKATSTSDAALKEINSMVVALNDKMKALGLDTDQLSEKAREAAGDIEKTLMREIKERPMRSLAIAGVVGLVLGMISRR